jgi:general secretion pathway protein A
LYSAFFGMSEEPFKLTPDPRFLHLAQPHRDALTALVEGVLLRKGFIMVTGPVGTGKTTLLHTALQFISSASFGKTPIATAFLVNPRLTRDEFFESLLDEFEVSCTSTSKPRRLAALYAMLLEKQRQGGTSVLVVDEAHLLSIELFEEIRLLNNTDTYREKLLQVVLAGQPEMISILDRPELAALKQRIASRCHLRSLSPAETRAYISDRMRAAGLKGPSPFNGPVYDDIHAYTAGVPRLINLVCESCLVMGFMSKRSEIGADIVEEAANSLGLTRSTELSVPAGMAAGKAAPSAGDFPAGMFKQRRGN